MRAFTLSNRGRPPLRASFIASIVTAFGISGSNGNAFSCANLGQQQAHCVGHGKAHRSQHGSRLFFHRSVDSGLYKLIGSHRRVFFVHDNVMHRVRQGKFKGVIREPTVA